ncbi:hypothetical protein [Winogradskyella sp. Asnod2-B02-A]|uniref:hypothetical protein n=1 Tax=Winogradskyella sp. Asnod2-B02-A TaxID=3160583 RepID=UPI00386C449B
MEAEKYDLILKHMLPSHGTNKTFTQNKFKRDLFKDLTTIEIISLIREMELANPNVCNFRWRGKNEPILFANEFTKVFLEQGGFSKIDNDLKKVEKKAIYKEDLELRKLKADLELVNNKLEDYGTTKAIAYISGIIGLVLTFLKIMELTKS